MPELAFVEPASEVDHVVTVVGGGDLVAALSNFVRNKKDWKVLWDGRVQPSSASGSASSFAGSPPITGEAATSPSSQSTGATISLGNDEGKARREDSTQSADCCKGDASVK